MMYIRILTTIVNQSFINHTTSVASREHAPAKFTKKIILHLTFKKKLCVHCNVGEHLGVSLSFFV